MKYTLSVLTLIILLTGTVISGAFLDFFHGRSDGNNIILEWKTRTESGIRSFEIERKAGNGGEFIRVSTVQPKGPNSFYTFTDQSAYKETKNIYIYRLKIIEVTSSPASYSNEVTVSHSVSSVKRTWGSIKAMFR